MCLHHRDACVKAQIAAALTAVYPRYRFASRLFEDRVLHVPAMLINECDTIRETGLWVSKTFSGL